MFMAVCVTQQTFHSQENQIELHAQQLQWNGFDKFDGKVMCLGACYCDYDLFDVDLLP